MVRGLTVALLGFLAISIVTSQTFQYSRGWTNGKRAENSPISSILDFKSTGENENHVSSLQARCASLHKWKMFLRSNDNEEVCRVPCEFLDVLRQCLRQDKAAFSLSSDYGRLSAPALETSSSLRSY